MLKVKVEGIPPVLRDHESWVVWKYDGEKKPPIHPVNHFPVDPLNPDNHLSFEDAFAAYEASDKVDGIGIVLTESDTLAAVDLDHLANPEEDWSKYGLDTYTELSPSGEGVHIFCRSSNQDLTHKGQGVEIYTSKRYITVTGHTLGQYTWIADCTSQLYNLYLNLSGRAYSQSRYNELLSDPRFREIWEGNFSSDSGAFSSQQSEADLALSHVLARYGWGEDEAVSLLREFRGKQLYDSGQDKSTRAEYFQRTYRKAVDSITQEQSRLDYENEELYNLENPQWLVQDRIPQGTVGMVWGRYGVAKTFFGIDLALSIVCGSSWFGSETTGGDVFYSLGEGTSTAKDRYRAWFEYHRVSRKHNFIFRPYSVQLINTSAVRELASYLNRKYINLRLIVFDTLARCIVGVDENAAEGIGRVVENVTLLAQETGATICVIHHAGKSSENERIGSETARGSSAWEAAIDWGIHLYPAKIKIAPAGNFELLKSLYAVRSSKSRQAEPFRPFVAYLQAQGDNAILRYSKYFTEQLMEHEPTDRYGISTADICIILDCYAAAQDPGSPPVNAVTIHNLLPHLSPSQIEQFLIKSGLLS